MSARDGGPAFPVSTSRKSGGAEFGGELGHQDSPNTWQFPGMTLRDHFAGQALAGMCAQKLSGIEAYTKDVAKMRELFSGFGLLAYELADAMLAARESQP